MPIKPENIKLEKDELSHFTVPRKGKFVPDLIEKLNQEVDIESSAYQVMNILRTEDDQEAFALAKEQVHLYFVKAIYHGKKDFVLKLIDNLITKYKEIIEKTKYPGLIEARMQERIEFLEDERELINSRG